MRALAAVVALILLGLSHPVEGSYRILGELNKSAILVPCGADGETGRSLKWAFVCPDSEPVADYARNICELTVEPHSTSDSGFGMLCQHFLRHMSSRALEMGVIQVGNNEALLTTAKKQPVRIIHSINWIRAENLFRLNTRYKVIVAVVTKSFYFCDPRGCLALVCDGEPDEVMYVIGGDPGAWGLNVNAINRYNRPVFEFGGSSLNPKRLVGHGDHPTSFYQRPNESDGANEYENRLNERPDGLPPSDFSRSRTGISRKFLGYQIVALTLLSLCFAALGGLSFAKAFDNRNRDRKWYLAAGGSVLLSIGLACLGWVGFLFLCDTGVVCT
ncbi:hypothetical protein [Aurantimonas aggregata]|uniref:hypothetical protein n=1 Tax=Aurantimonas aggregata TaxID=2047720 RepID=UPI0019458D83|nr:hypothetical protein [Aurantimonas aggregata]